MDNNSTPANTTTPGPRDRPGPDGAPSLFELDRSLAELSAHIDAAKHEQLSLIAEFDRREGWALGGFRSCAHWLGVRIGLGHAAAREHVCRQRCLREPVSAASPGSTDPAADFGAVLRPSLDRMEIKTWHTGMVDLPVEGEATSPGRQRFAIL